MPGQVLDWTNTNTEIMMGRMGLRLDPDSTAELPEPATC